jgi:hypothetical protein
MRSPTNLPPTATPEPAVDGAGRASAADSGQVLPLLALVLAAAALAAVVLAHVAVQQHGRARAAHAADAAALAGAMAGEGAAVALATANDAQLVSFTRDGDVVAVEVRRDGHGARARAETVVELTGR